MREFERLRAFGRNRVLTDAEIAALERRGWFFRDGRWWHPDADQGDATWQADIARANETERSGNVSGNNRWK